MPEFETKDSGAREEYDSGMRRDTEEGKARFDLTVPLGVPYSELMLTRWADLMARGAEKYTARNWELADSQKELDRYYSSAFRHFMQWLTGETDEDHAAAVFFNINCAETLKYKMANQPPKKYAEGGKIDGGFVFTPDTSFVVNYPPPGPNSVPEALRLQHAAQIRADRIQG